MESALIALLGTIVVAVIGYLVGRKQQSANVAKTLTETRIAEEIAKIETAKQAVEVRLLDIEAKQTELTFHQNYISDIETRAKEKDLERAAEQAALRAQVDEIKSVQLAAQNLYNDRIEELLKNIDGMIVSLGNADSKIVTLQEQVDQGNKLIGALRLEVEGSNTIITALQTQVEGLQNEVREGNVIITTLREEIKVLLVQKVETEKEVAVNDARVKASE